MHKYLSAVGLNKSVDEHRLSEYINQAVHTTPAIYHCINSESVSYVEFRYIMKAGLGIAVRGYYDLMDVFHVDYYYPIFEAYEVSATGTNFETERFKDRESYCGICDDSRLGVTLVFYLQNALELISKKMESGNGDPRNICLSALSIEGRILLPVKKRYLFDDEEEQLEGEAARRSSLVAAARNGDEQAFESLTMEDMDVYALISQRVEKEDVLSIVDTTFIPFGIESDVYSIIGTIEDVDLVVNPLTLDKVYIMSIKCNDISFSLAINTNDLEGTPKKGRRFRGIIWMQGTICI